MYCSVTLLRPDRRLAVPGQESPVASDAAVDAKISRGARLFQSYRLKQELSLGKSLPVVLCIPAPACIARPLPAIQSPTESRLLGMFASKYVAAIVANRSLQPIDFVSGRLPLDT